MVKSPEQYLSSFDFNLDPGDFSHSGLNSGERAFVEKYLGLDALEKMPRVEPERANIPFPHKEKRNKDKPEIRVAPPEIAEKFEEREKESQDESAPIIARNSLLPPSSDSSASETLELLPQIEQIPATQVILPVMESPARFPEIIINEKQDFIENSSETGKKAEMPSEQKELAVQVVVEDKPEDDSTSKPAEAQVTAQIESPIISEAFQDSEVREVEQPAPDLEPAENADTQEEPDSVSPVDESQVIMAEPASVQTKTTQVENESIRERLKQEKEIQMVSFLVSGQLFLLPVMAIQEVLRHTELVKVPQAPDFVAGAINLRGRVTPLIYLAHLVTGDQSRSYSDKNFVIICGSDDLQLGLIIDKISSMHMVPQEKIIWNVEARLGDAGEFLCAIANLDEKVCGIIAPEIITQKLLAP